MAFVHLHTHTEFSLLDGSNKIKEYVSRVKELGMTAAAITDHGVMYGVIDFYRECLAQGIHPVLGCEVYVAPGSRLDRESGHGEDRYYHLILLAENNTGYANLMKIVSYGFIDGYYYKPRVDRGILEKYHEGIICTSACLAGEVQRDLARGQYEEARAAALWHRDCFGPDNYFLELQDHGIPMQQTVNSGLLRLSQETGIPLVATNDCHYTYAGDADAHDVLLCIQTGKHLNDTDRMRYEGGQYYVKSEAEMRSLFPYAGEALDNTQKIADRCHVEIEFGVTKLPFFQVPEGYDSWTYLNKLCFDGLDRRYGANKAAQLRPQLEYELKTIQDMGYVDYFLIVWDFINFARTHGIPVGPGRGSAAGSLVSYTTGITNIDPVRYALVFERFLNPERVSMPDIDIDFSDERRGEVIDYVVDKYGKDCVTQIVTFGTMKAKNAIRDVGRVMEVPLPVVNKITKGIPNELGITIEKALEMNSELRDMYEGDEQIKTMIDTAKRLEGLPRNTSMHAAGVVISQKPMMEYVPLSRSTSDGPLTTQFIMTTIEELGLLKMDFLGLRTLSVIDNACKDIKKNYNVDINFDTMIYDDPDVFASIASGKTEGVFQLESAGMKSFMKELAPGNLEDVIAGISLYRPGPMDFIPKYIAGKNDRDSIRYDCPQLEPILSPTYGCIVYQEQVMQIVRDLAGYSMGRSDLVRRAMSKKKTHVMEEERKNFVYGNPNENVKGCVANGISEEVANKIYDEMIDFAKYAFNKSHAACYAVVAYQTAYLKYYYPAEFMAALMTSVLEDSKKVSNYIRVCRDMGIEVLPPSVNVGAGRFTVDQGKIRYGLNAVHSVGGPVVEAICQVRNQGGPFTSLEDFIRRTMDSKINKSAIENLIKAGALDDLPGNRREKIMSYQQIMDGLSSRKKGSIEGQMTMADLLGGNLSQQFSFRMPTLEEFDRETFLAFEKDVLGIYISGHPLEEYVPLMEKNITASSEDFAWDEESQACALQDNKSVVIAGIITDKTIKFTKKNQTMAFMTVEDLEGSVETIVFPQTFERCRSKIETDHKVFVSGHVSVEDEKDAKLIADDIVEFSEAVRDVWLQFDTPADFEAAKDRIFSYLQDKDGRDNLIVYTRSDKKILKMPPNWCFTADPDILANLRSQVGEENLRIVEKNVEFKGKQR